MNVGAVCSTGIGNNSKGKGKVRPSTGHEDPEGE